MGSQQKVTVPTIGCDTERVVIDFDKDGGKILVHGTTVPADGVSGYAPGCFFIDEDGGQGATLFVNEGTLASANFDLVTTA